MERIKKISMHRPITAYNYELDNKPLEQLAANDVRLQKQIDKIQERLFETIRYDFTRNLFKPLRPSVALRDSSYLQVAPGSFICRMPTRSGPWSSEKPIGSGLNTRANGLEIGHSEANTQADEEYHKYGETNRTAVIFYKGGSVKFEPWDDNDFNWKLDYGDATPDPPEARIDLVCVQGFPSEDQSGENPTSLGTSESSPNLVVIKGAGWRNFPTLTSAGEYDQLGTHLYDGMFRGEDPNITAAHYSQGGYYYGVGTSIHPMHGASKYWDATMAPSPGLMRTKTYAISRTGLDYLDPNLEVGTIPAPDDIINSAFHVTPEHVEIFTSVASGLDAQSWAATMPTDQVGLFCVPIAYVRIPRGYSGGSIRPGNIQDIRPLLRSAELTLSEREGLSNMYKPEADNRVLSVMDSDYTALIDYILREDQWNRYELQYLWNDSDTPQRNLIPGNHEGRIRAMEAAVVRPQVQLAPHNSFGSIPIPFSNGTDPDTYYQAVTWGENFREYYVAGPKYYPGYKPYDPGLYWQPGQYIPCVRNYLNRFLNEVYDPRERWTRRGALGGHPYEEPYRIFGATDVQVRRQVIRGKFLSYSSEYHNAKLPYKAFRIARGGHYGGTGDPMRRVLYEGAGPNVSHKYPEWDRYKLQTVELNFTWPKYDPDRDQEEECYEVWHQGEKSGGWTGFGHGGSYDNAGWHTVCKMVNEGKVAENQVGFRIKPGFVPYWIDTDALGFAPGTIDCLQINSFDLGDYNGDHGQMVAFRFNKRGPRYSHDSDTPSYPYNDPYTSLDQRRRYMGNSGSWSSKGTAGERLTYGDYAVNQVSYGYSGFCMLVYIGASETDETHYTTWPGRHFWVPHFLWRWTPWQDRKTKIVITGPAHSFFNGAFLPIASNSDCGDRANGETWID